MYNDHDEMTPINQNRDQNENNLGGLQCNFSSVIDIEEETNYGKNILKK